MTTSPTSTVTFALAAALAASSCGSHAEGAHPPAGTPTAPEVAQQAQLGPPPAGDGSIPTLPPGTFEVHEWGLLRARAGDQLDVGAVAPVVPPEPIAVDKPVLYFYAGSALAIQRVEVHASGLIREHWPITSRGMSPSIVWQGLALDPARPAGTSACASGAPPRATDPPCADLPAGEACESSGLGPLVAPGAACLTDASGAHALLFYRSRTGTFTPPLRVERLASGELRATNAGGWPIPGSLVVLRRRGGGTVARALAPPAPGQSIAIGATTDGDETDSPALPSDVEAGRRAIRDTMRAIGMTDGEIDAFLRAWDPALFGTPSLAADSRPADVLVTDRRGVDDLPAATDSVLYFLPQRACDGVSRLELSPAPRTVRRALAVWGRLP